MDREAILKRSRAESRGMDIANIEASKNGMRAGWIVTALLAAVILVVDYFAFGRFCYELLFAISAGLAAVFTCKYFRLRRRHELFVAVCYAVAAAAWFTAWMLEIAER